MCKLKSCPFCGSLEVQVQYNEKKKPNPHYVACLSCGATGRYAQELWYAIESWNARIENLDIIKVGKYELDKVSSYVDSLECAVREFRASCDGIRIKLQEMEEKIK